MIQECLVNSLRASDRFDLHHVMFARHTKSEQSGTTSEQSRCDCVDVSWAQPTIDSPAKRSCVTWRM